MNASKPEPLRPASIPEKATVDGLEAKVGELEATQFSTTTKLKGEATFDMGAYTYGGSAKKGNSGPGVEELFSAFVFNYDVRLNFDTSFTGKDLLRTTLRAGNFADSAFGNGGLNTLEVAFQEDCGTDTDCGRRRGHGAGVGLSAQRTSARVNGRQRKVHGMGSAFWVK